MGTELPDYGAVPRFNKNPTKEAFSGSGRSSSRNDHGHRNRLRAVLWCRPRPGTRSRSLSRSHSGSTAGSACRLGYLVAGAGRKRNGTLGMRDGDKQTFVHGNCRRQVATLPNGDTMGARYLLSQLK